MTTKLTPQEKASLASYRLSRAYETLEAAQYLAAGNFFNSAVNRLYYAAYYAASSLLTANDLDTSTHKGVKILLGMHFIQNGILEKEYGLIYQRLFESRQSGDYEEFVYYDSPSFLDLLPLAERFVQRISQLLKV